MSQWQEIYRRLEQEGALKREAEQTHGTAWLEPLWPLLGVPVGVALDLGCGTGADMRRYAERGWQPVGLDREPLAASLVQRHLGFPALVGDLSEPLPFSDGSFTLVAARCALHFVPPRHTPRLYQEIRRVLRPSGRLLFVVNSETHRQEGLQYDYTGATEIEPGWWHLPTIGRTYLFYSPDLVREMLGEGWQILLLEERDFDQWAIPKRVVLCVAERLPDSSPRTTRHQPPSHPFGEP